MGTLVSADLPRSMASCADIIADSGDVGKVLDKMDVGTMRKGLDHPVFTQSRPQTLYVSV